MSRAPSRPRSAPRSKAKPPALPDPVTIERLGGQGDGVAQAAGVSLFVPLSAPGDVVRLTIGEKKGDGWTAQIAEMVTPSPLRVKPPCPQFGICGGCALQHIDPGAYAEWKRGLLIERLRLAHMDTDIAPLIRIAPGTRRRATFAFSFRRGRGFLGFHGHASHRLADLSECMVLVPALSALLPPLKAMLARLAPDDSGEASATVAETGLDVSVNTKRVLDLNAREALAAFAEDQNLARLTWRDEPVARRRGPLLTMGGAAVELPSGGFIQPSAEGEAALVSLVTAAIGPGGAVADLYSGCGSFTLPLAATGAKVHAVEGEAASLGALDQAARRAGYQVSTEARDLARRPLLPHELARYRAVVFDPPRAGAAPQAEQLAVGGPKLVVAVSCNPATLARDLRTLMDGGYRLETITPVDQFPFSAHLEAVAVLRR